MLTLDKAEQFEMQSRQEQRLFAAWLRGELTPQESACQDNQDQQECINLTFTGKTRSQVLDEFWREAARNDCQ